MSSRPSNPPDQYPNADWKYPNTGDGSPGDPCEPELERPSFQPSFEAELYRLAPSRVTVLLVGGPEQLKRGVALALHERSPRGAQPFVMIDCRGRSSDSVEEELFGGPAYVTLRAGAIHEAAAGTLYVASIDELPLLTQPRFLRFLDQDRRVRVVASTDVDLPTRVHQGHFRLDLAERLSLVQLWLPSAR